MAATSLGRLTLDMVVKLGNYTEGLDRASRQAKKSGKEIESGLNVGKLAITALGAAAAGLSVTAISDFAFKTIDAGNEVKKFSQLANTSMRDFQYYSKGAQTAGMSIESFADKMKDMQDRIGDFQQTGGGPLADFFENIAPLVGVTIQQFQKLSGPDALQLYYDSLVKVGATQNDMKFYMEAIISDSSLLLPLLENNGAGFKKWGDAAERTGAILSDDVVNSLTKAKENMQMMDLQWQGFQANLVNNAIPVFELVVDHMDDIKAVGVAVAVAYATKFIPTVLASGIQLAQLGVVAVRAGTGLIGLAGSAGIASGAMTVLRSAVAFLGGPAGIAMLAIQGIAAGSAFLYMKKSSSDAEQALSKQGKSVSDLVAEYDKLSSAQQRAFKYQEATELKELTETYTKAQQQVRMYASGIAEVFAKDDATKNTIRGWIKEFDAQKISAEQLANRINSLSNINAESKTHMDKHAIASTNAKTAMDAQLKVVNSLNVANKTAAQTNKEVTETISAQEKAWLSLNQKQRKVVVDLKQQALRESYINNNMARGWSREKAEYFADKRSEAGENYTKVLSKEMFVQIEAGYKLQQQIKAREESEKSIVEAKKKQVDSQKKLNDLVGASALSGLRIKSGESVAGGKVRGYTAEFAQLAQQSLGSTLNRFTAFNDSYHKGTNSKHATGNAFDFTVNNAKEAAAAVKQLNDIAKRYGFTIKAINEYSDPSKRSTGGHVHVSVLGYNGREDAISDAKAEVNLVRDSIDELEEIRKQTLERQKAVQQTYFSEEQQMLEDHKEKIKAIEDAFAGDDSAIKKYSDLENDAYAKSVSQYKQSLTQKTLDEKKQLLEVRKNWISAEDYARQYYELVREEILNTSEYSPELKDAMLKQANIERGVAENEKREQVWGDYQYRFGVEKSPYQSDIDLLKEAREQMLITEEEYQQRRLQMQGLYGGRYAADFAGMMMGLVDSSSSAYALLGSAQKAFTLFSVGLSSIDAIGKAWASAPFPYNLPAVGMATMETGLLQAAVSALTPVGMAHNGIDNIPKEGTWLLDGGERVLNPQQNKDLTNYLANKPTQSQHIDNKLSVIMVKDEDDAKDMLYGPDGEKAFLYHMKRNRSKA